MNPDGSPQLAFVLVLADGGGNSSILSSASCKSKRVVRSVLGAEISAFADAVDEALLLRQDLRTILHRNIPLRALTDISSLFSIIIRSTTATERRLMIDLKAAREAFDSREIAEIGWINRERNVADALTKFPPCDALTSLLNDQKLDDKALQWVLRDASPPKREASQSDRGSACDVPKSG